MFKNIAALPLACLAIPALATGETGLFGERLIWGKDAGTLFNYSVLEIPTSECPGDLKVKLAEPVLTNPTAKSSAFSIKAWATESPDGKYWVTRTGVECEDGDAYQCLSSDYLTAEASVDAEIQCWEKAKLSISAGPDGEVLFHTDDPQLQESVRKAGGTLAEQ